MNIIRRKKLSQKHLPMCKDCHVPLKWTNVYNGNTTAHVLSDYVGPFIVNEMFLQCPKCKRISYSNSLSEKIIDAFCETVEKLLHEKYPIETNDYITLNEIEAAENNDKPFEDWQIRNLKMRIFSCVFNGERLYLKKSFDLSQKNCGCGLFNLNGLTEKRTNNNKVVPKAKKIIKRRLRLKKEKLCFKKCSLCGRRVIRKRTFSTIDAYVGLISVRGDYWYCRHCKTGGMTSLLSKAVENAIIDKTAELLPKIYPFETNEYITLKEFEKMSGRKLQEILHTIRLFVPSTIKDGQLFFLKEAVNRNLEQKESRVKLLN